MNSRWTTRSVTSAAALLVALAVVPAVWPPLRLGAAAVFCLLVPGSGWACRLARTGGIRPADRLAVALVLSVCATILITTAMAVAGRWSTPGGVAVLAAVAAAGYAPWARWADGADRFLRHARGRRRRGRRGGGAMEPR